jgi:manganese/zinc/iron transport system permease protein
MIPEFHLWAMATAAAVAASCATVGTLLVVRRMSLVGDAIAHALLPGIAVAVLAGGRPGGVLVFVAAVAASLATVGLTHWLRSAGGIAEDAGLGVVFTTFFALGVVLVSAAARRIDLDPACVLYGILELVPFDTVTMLGREIPRGFLSAVAVLAAVAIGLAATWKFQVFTAFDADAARAAGVPVAAVTTGLLAATAVATVSGFEVAGAILVVAMLVAPAAAAELLVRRLSLVMLVAVLLGVTAAVVGYLLAWRWNTNAAGMIAVVLGAEYLAAVVFAADDGLVARGLRRGAFAWRVACEDRLAAVWRGAEKASGGGLASVGGGQAEAGRGVPLPLSRGLLDRAALLWLRASGRLHVRAGRAWLSDMGRREAEVVVRSHRLWEAWLGRHAELPLDHLHPPAEWVEHHLGAAMRQRIEAEVGLREADPHGRDIPPE